MNTFDGPDFDEEKDGDRLRQQLRVVRSHMLDGRWRTLATISRELHFPEASISARLRDLRKERFGSYTVEKRRLPTLGTWEYRVTAPIKDYQQAALFDAPAVSMRGH